MNTTYLEDSDEHLTQKLQSFLHHGTPSDPRASVPRLGQMMRGSAEQKATREQAFHEAKAVALCVSLLKRLPEDSRADAARKILEKIAGPSTEDKPLEFY